MVESVRVKVISWAILIAEIFPHVSSGQHTLIDTTGFLFVKKSHGISLYEKWERCGTKEARVVKAAFTVNAIMEAFPKLLKDERIGQEWNSHSCEYRTLLNVNLWYCYIMYDLPWPLGNQDCVLKYNDTHLPGTYVATFASTSHKFFPVRENVTRITDIKGQWIVTVVHHQLKVEYYITTKPSTTLPKWITDPVIRNNLIQTMYAVKKRLLKDHFLNEEQ